MSEGNGVVQLSPQAPQPQMQLNGHQLSAMLVIERLAQDMQVCVNQLGAFVGYTAAADVVLHAQQKLMRDYEALRQQWGKQVQIASPNVVRSIIPSKG